MFQLVFFKNKKLGEISSRRSKLIVGCDSSLFAPFLPLSRMEKRQLEFLEKDGFYQLSNLALDPLVTINHQPFGKRRLKSGDTIEIDDTSILFFVQNNWDKQQLPSLPFVKTDPTNGTLKTTKPPSSLEIVSKDAELLTLLSEVDHLAKTAPLSQPKILSSQEEELIEELFQDPLDPQKEEVSEKRELLQRPMTHTSFRSLSSIIIATFLTLFSLCTTAFFFQRERNTKHERIAMLALADVMMALHSSNMHQSLPENQDLTNQNFLLERIEELLPPQESSLYQPDQGHHLRNTPFFIRSYFNDDFSEFLLIAQPSSTPLQWLIPKKSIAIHSRDMELRSIDSLTALNRLLALEEPLHGKSSQEVLDLLRSFPSMRLKELKDQQARLPLALPKELRKQLAGRENKIHYASRYHLHGEALLGNLESLVNPDLQDRLWLNRLELTRRQIESLQKLPKPVLFIPGGAERAQRIQRILSLYFPEQELELGIIDETEVNVQPEVTLVAMRPSLLREPGSSNLTLESPSSAELEIYETIQMLVQKRERALIAMYHPLLQLIAKHSKTPVADFTLQLHELLTNYQEIEERETELLRLSIRQLYERTVLGEAIAKERFYHLALLADISSFIPIEESQSADELEGEPLFEPYQ